MNVSYFLFAVWDWIIQHGLPLSALLIIAILIPRLGRQLVRFISDRFEHGEEETKSRLALVGALVYILEIVAYFAIIMVALTNLGVPAVGAAVPATVVSAAIGFGAQNIIGDFLYGFFIISERHYGVGDVVKFDDTSSSVSGTVVKLTLRSTQIRTGSGELVTIPNSQASVTTNSSQKWSRAVVDLDLPLTDGESMTDLVNKVNKAAHDAIDAAGVNANIRGDINVLPALNITPPSAAGLSWSVGMEVNVETSPATQWAVERAIRANLVNTFWDRYQAPGQATAALEDIEAPGAKHVAGTRGAAHASTTPTSHADDADETQQIVAAATSGTNPDALHPEDIEGGDSTDESDHADTSNADESTAAFGAEDTTTVFPTETRPTAGSGDTDDSPAADGGRTKDKDAGSDTEDSLLDGPYDSKAKNALSIGGRFRPSTLGLFIALAVVGLLAFFSTNPDDGTAGWLSPDRYRSTSTTEESSEAPTETPTEDTATEQPAEETDTDQDTVTDENEDTGDQGTSEDTGTSDDSGSAGTQDDSGSGQSDGSTDTTGTNDDQNGGSGVGTQQDEETGSGSNQNDSQNQSQGAADTAGDSTEEPTVS